MLKEIKSKLGFIKRGVFGIWQNCFESVPHVSKAVLASIIGNSTQGRDIVCYKVGQGAKPVLFVSGIHGNEVGTVKLANHLINYLQTEATLCSQFTFYIIPLLNPDGYELAKQNPDYFGGGRVGRFNYSNVDLNRNFPTPSFQSHSVWSTGKNYSENIKVFCGNQPGSEPETQALIKFILDKQIKIYIAFHSVAGDVMGSNDTLAQEMTDIFAKASGYFREPKDHWDKLGQTGTAKEWCDRSNISYLEIEGRYRWSSDWPAHKKGLEAILEMLF